MRKILAAAAIVAAGSFLLPGAAFADGPLIAVINKNHINPAYAAARRGFDLVAKDIDALSESLDR